MRFAAGLDNSTYQFNIMCSLKKIELMNGHQKTWQNWGIPFGKYLKNFQRKEIEHTNFLQVCCRGCHNIHCERYYIIYSKFRKRSGDCRTSLRGESKWCHYVVLKRHILYIFRIINTYLYIVYN